MSSTDPYVYPWTTVLRNLFDCKDKEELLQIEADASVARLIVLAQNPIDGKFDYKHLCDIHKYIFQDVYEWAGLQRTVDIGKGNLFCRVQFIQDYADNTFKDLYKSCLTAKEDPKAFVKTVASYYSDVNALHPFREGNGRTQREFFRELCLKCGYIFDLTVLTRDEMLSASIESFNAGNGAALEKLFVKAIIPESEYEIPNDSILTIFTQGDGLEKQ